MTVKNQTEVTFDCHVAPLEAGLLAAYGAANWSSGTPPEHAILVIVSDAIDVILRQSACQGYSGINPHLNGDINPWTHSLLKLSFSLTSYSGISTTP
jgi:hypothetical protein